MNDPHAHETGAVLAQLEYAGFNMGGAKKNGSNGGNGAPRVLNPAFIPEGTQAHHLEEAAAEVQAVVQEHAGSLDHVQALIARECDELAKLLLAKNRKYGNSALDPIRVFSKAGPTEQILVRIDDKLNRIRAGNGDLPDEDTVQDLIGYLLLLRVARKLQVLRGSGVHPKAQP